MIKNLSKEVGLLIFLGLILVTLVFYICFWSSASKESIAYKQIDNNSVAAIGINFDNGKSFIIDPYSEEEVLPCKKTTISSEGKNTKGMQNCKINETEIIASEQVINTIRNSREIFEGFVINEGKKTPAKFTLSVSALYEGSLCHTYWSAGDQLENCISVKTRCNSYCKNKLDRIARSKDPAGLRRQCTALSSKWPAEFIR